MKTFLFFFFEITCFRPEKPLEFPISAGKSLAIFAPHLVHLIQIGINFSCPRAPLEFTQNKLLVPPQNLFLPPQSRYPGAGRVGNAFVSGEGGMGFKRQAGKIRHSVANGWTPLRHIFERSRVARMRIDVKMGPPIRHTLWRNTASLMRDLIWYLKNSSRFRGRSVQKKNYLKVECYL